MLRNYLLITLRNFKSQKLFSLLNIFGLALGLASAILIFLYVNDELSYDTMQPHYNDTYRIGCTSLIRMVSVMTILSRPASSCAT